MSGMSDANAAALWARLHQAGLTAGEAPPGAASVTPWYIRAMLGIAGWIGALFLLGFVGGAFSLVFRSAAAALALGALTCAAAAFMFRTRPHGDFMSQFALAVSLAGQALVGFGLAQWLPSQLALVMLVFAALQAALFLLVPNFLHRVLSATLGTGAFTNALGSWGFLPYIEALVFAALAWAWLNEFRFPGRTDQMRAIGYGLTLLVLFGLATHSALGLERALWEIRGEVPFVGGEFGFRIGAALVGAITIAVVWRLLVRQGVALNEGPALAALGAAAVLALLSLEAPGLGITVTLLLLGYANGNRVLAGLGVAALLAYWSYYYYSLELTLLQKSILLVCAGVALLAARLAMKRRWPAAAGREAGDA